MRRQREAWDNRMQIYVGQNLDESYQRHSAAVYELVLFTSCHDASISSARPR